MRGRIGILVSVFLAFVLFSEKCATAEPPVKEGIPIKVGILLLKNGGMFQGSIREFNEIITMETQFGELNLKKTDIEFIGTEIADVYQHKKSQAVTSYDFMALAEWCFRNDLKTEGATEYDRAIASANSSVSAKEMQRRKESLLNPDRENSLKPLLETFSEEEQKFLAWEKSVPEETLTGFKNGVQPLLFRRCNGLACHGNNAVSSFKLEPLTRGKEKVQTLQNLATVLRYLEPETPTQSPLLQVPIVPHGKAKQIFTQKLLPQYETLYFWSMDAMKKMNDYYPLEEPDRKSKHFSPVNAATFRSEFPKPGVPLLETNPEKLPSEPSSAEGFPETSGGFGPRIELKTSENGTVAVRSVESAPKIVDPAQTQAMMEQRKNNPFDPSEFNQQFHPERVNVKHGP